MDALTPAAPPPGATALSPAPRRAQEAPAAAVAAPVPREPAVGLPPLPAVVQRAQLDPPPPPPKLMSREQMAALLALTT